MENLIEYTSNGLKINNIFYSLDEIEENVRLKEVKEKELVILSLEWSGFRGFDGPKEKVIVNKSSAIKFKEDFKGVNVYFGEIAGKHSDVEGVLEDKDIEIISDTKKVVSFLKNNSSGHDYNYSFIEAIKDSILDKMVDNYSIDKFNKLFEY